ncbi:hypothetical protein V8C86DRAFT_2564168, partial [Haematococcus lacustris]
MLTMSNQPLPALWLKLWRLLLSSLFPGFGTDPGCKLPPEVQVAPGLLAPLHCAQLAAGGLVPLPHPNRGRTQVWLHSRLQQLAGRLPDSVDWQGGVVMMTCWRLGCSAVGPT